ncbi:MAG TPA: DedA family protein [Fimbriiglobus sp.]|jgi:membrane protein DedA with SNARE-associated domain
MFTNFAQYGYVGVFAALLAAGFGLPIPEELPVLTAGVLVGHADTLKAGATTLDPHRLHWYFMWPLCVLGVVVSDSILYFIGRAWGHRLLDVGWVKRKVVPPDKRAKIEKNFQDRGIVILLTARLTPGIRTPVFVMAGILKVRARQFILADALYAIPGVSILFWISYFLTDQVLEVFSKIEQYRPIIVVGVLSAVAGVIIYRLVANRTTVNTGDRTDLPIYAKPVEKVTQAIEQAAERALDKMEHAIDKVKHHRHPDDVAKKPSGEMPKVPVPSANGILEDAKAGAQKVHTTPGQP